MGLVAVISILVLGGVYCGYQYKSLIKASEPKKEHKCDCNGDCGDDCKCKHE